MPKIQAFEATIIADYSAETAVARELVLRLASLLWRLRRATAIETDLLELHTEELEERKAHEGTSPDLHPLGCPFKGIGRLGLARNPVSGSWVTEEECATDEHQTEVCGQSDDDFARTTRHLTYSFLRLAKLDSDVFERLNR